MMRQACSTSTSNLWKWMSVDELAQHFGKCPMTIYRWSKKGSIPALKIGGRWHYRADILTRYLELEMERQTQARAAWHPQPRSESSQQVYSSS